MMTELFCLIVAGAGIGFFFYMVGFFHHKISVWVKLRRQRLQIVTFIEWWWQEDIMGSPCPPDLTQSIRTNNMPEAPNAKA